MYICMYVYTHDFWFQSVPRRLLRLAAFRQVSFRRAEETATKARTGKADILWLFNIVTENDPFIDDKTYFTYSKCLVFMLESMFIIIFSISNLIKIIFLRVNSVNPGRSCSTRGAALRSLRPSLRAARPRRPRPRAAAARPRRRRRRPRPSRRRLHGEVADGVAASPFF